MASKTQTRTANEVDPRIFHAPCAFNPKGATEEMCKNLTRILQRNKNGCCGNDYFPPCRSKARVCWVCISEGLNPSPVRDFETGKCEKHLKNKVLSAPEKEVVPVSITPQKTTPSQVKVSREVVANTSPPSVVQKAVEIQTPTRPRSSPLKLVHSTGEEPDQKKEEWKLLLERVHRAMGQAEYIKIHPDFIQPMPGQPRAWFDEHDLRELANSIKKVGQFQPGIIRRIPPNGKYIYEILDGERRLRATHLAGVEVYKAMLVEIDDEAAPFVIASIANFNRAGHTDMEISDAIERLHNGLKIPIPEIAKMYDINEHWAYQLHGLQKLDPRIRSMLDPRLKRRQKLPVTAAIQVAKLEPGVQGILVEKFREGKVSLKGLRREALAIANETGTSIRKRWADEPARRARSILNLSKMVAKTMKDLKMLMEEAGSGEILNKLAREKRTEILGNLGEASTVIAQCKTLVSKE